MKMYNISMLIAKYAFDLLQLNLFMFANENLINALSENKKCSKCIEWK